MKKGLRGKALLLCLALVVALAATGVGFAHWNGTLDITGTVNTGKVCVGWFDYSPKSDENPDELWNPTGFSYPGSQNIATGTMAYADFLCNAPTPPPVVGGPLGPVLPHYQTLVVTIDNAYPYYYADWQIHAHNCGTIPILMSLPVIVAPSQLVVTCPDGPVGLFPLKVHPCEEVVFSLKVWCKQPATMDPADTSGVQPGGGPYSFTVTIPYEQAQ